MVDVMEKVFPVRTLKDGINVIDKSYSNFGVGSVTDIAVYSWLQFVPPIATSLVCW